MTFTNLLKCSALALCMTSILPSSPLTSGNWAQSWQSHAAQQADFTGRIKRVRIKKKRVGSSFKITTTTNATETIAASLTHEISYVSTDGTEVALPALRVRKPTKMRARYIEKLRSTELKEGPNEVDIPIAVSVRKAVIDRGTINTGDSVEIISFSGSYKASYTVKNGVVSATSPLTELDLHAPDGTSLKEFGVKPRIRLQENGEINFDASGNPEAISVLFDATIAEIGVKIDERQADPQSKVSTWATDIPFIEDKTLEGLLYFVTTTVSDEEGNIIDRKTLTDVVENSEGETNRKGAIFNKIRLNKTKANQLRVVIITADDTEDKAPASTTLSIATIDGKTLIGSSNLKSSTHEYRYVTAPLSLDLSTANAGNTGFIFDILDSKGGVFDQIEVNLSVKDRDSDCGTLLCGETTHFKYAPNLIKVVSETEKLPLYQLSLALSGEEKPYAVNVRPIAAANERVVQTDMPLAVTFKKDIYKGAKGSAGNGERLNLNLRLTDNDAVSDVIGGLTDGPVTNGPVVFHNGKGTKSSASSARGKPQLL